MDVSKVISELRAERDRIDQAIAALEALSSNAPRTITYTQPQAGPQAATKASAKKRGARGAMTAERRRSLSEAAKKRWAQRKRTTQTSTSATQTAPIQAAAKQVSKRGLTAAGRKRISEMMKKRWAERRHAAAKAA